MDHRREPELSPASASGIPRLSVIVASLNGRSHLERCLDSILLERTVNVEIIVASRDAGPVPELAKKYEGVRLIRFPERTALPVLLAAGIENSRGEIIAVTESSCIADPGWIPSIMRSHTGDWPVIGGAVDATPSRKLTNWAAYFIDYSQFMTSGRSGVASAVSGNNFSIKRSALEFGTRFIKGEFWKTHWCRALQAEGFELFFEPAISVQCEKDYELRPFLKRRFYQGRCFAGLRGEQMKPWNRIAFVLGAVFLPVVLLYRTAIPFVRCKRLIGRFAMSLPITILAIAAWSSGEAAGYLTGAGNSCRMID